MLKDAEDITALQAPLIHAVCKSFYSLQQSLASLAMLTARDGQDKLIWTCLKHLFIPENPYMPFSFLFPVLPAMGPSFQV